MSKAEILNKNKNYSESYFQRIGNPKVPIEIVDVIKNSKRILDLGCGDGGIITAISNTFKDKELFGVDISPRRIGGLVKRIPHGQFVCGDVCKTALKERFFDLIISTQVIEHLENDCDFVKEVERLLKPAGYLYVTSVIKKPWAVYIYRNNGKFVLDPTHVKEYKHKEEFLDLFKEGFRLVKLNIFPVERKKIFTVKIPGYYIIETLWQKRTGE